MAVDKDKNVLKSRIVGSNLNEDIKGRPGVDGWDKNIKRKRSVGGTSARILEADREAKLALQRRHACNPHPRSSESYSFRTSIREDSLSGKESNLAEGKASRMPRSALISLPTSSSCLPTTPEGFEGWEHSRCLNEAQFPDAPNPHKHSIPLGPSSSTITQWGGQRQKSFRTRRTNVIPPVSSHEGSLFSIERFSSDIGAKLASSNPSRAILCKAILSNSQLNSNVQNSVSPTLVVESDERRIAENRSKDRVTKSCKIEDSIANVSQKVTEPETLPIKKNTDHEEELEALQKHARSLRGSAQSKSSLPLKGKLEVPEMTKMIRSGRPFLDRNQSKAGPPSKKIADCRDDFHPGDCGDDHDELIAASAYAHYVVSMHSFQSSSDITFEFFWEKMRPFFAFVSSDKITHLKEMIKLAADMDGCFELDAHDKDGVFQQGLSQSLSIKQINDNQSNATEHSTHPGLSVKEQNGAGRRNLGQNGCRETTIPLSQRLFAAIIPQLETESCSYSTDANLYSNVAKDYSNAIHGLTGFDSEDAKNQLVMENDKCLSFKSQSRDKFSCDDFAVFSDARNSSVSGDLHMTGLHQNFTTPNYNTKARPVYMQNVMGHVRNVDEIFSGPPSDLLYEHMSIDDKILLELQSIGVCLDTEPDPNDGKDNEIDKDICKLMTGLYGQMGKKKQHLCNLQNVIQNQRLLEERNLEQIAMNKLVEMAYGKLAAGRGSHTSTYNGGHSRVSKRAALSFAKRVLARCHKFENTGKSCFSDPPYRDILLSSLLSGESGSFVVDGQVASDLQSWPPCKYLVDRHRAVGFKFGNTYLDPFKCFPHLQVPPLSRKDKISNKGRKRELPLDEVVSASSRAQFALTNTLPDSLKEKRSEKNHDQSMNISSRSFTKSGRQSLGLSKGERTTRSKQRTTRLQTSANGLSNGPGAEALSPTVLLSDGSKSDHGGHRAAPLHPINCDHRLSKETESPDSLNQPLHMPDELGSQAHDISMWLDVDEDSLQDIELKGLEIPMDDLSELDMNF